jgi:hypothetical protein
MSDVSQGAGWWQASDGKWYPPESHPDYPASRPEPVPAANPTDRPTELTLRPSPLDKEAAMALLDELRDVERSLWAVRDELRRLLEDGPST